MNTDEKILVKYYRISLEDEMDGESKTIHNQRNIIESYIKNDTELASMQSQEFIDDGYTGTNFNRPGMQKILELFRQNKVACIIVKDFSRFTRDYIELGNYVEQIFPFMGIRFISVNERYDSQIHTSLSGLEIPFKGLLNSLYSKDISVKMKSAKRQLIKQGKICSGSHPFGYQKRKDGGMIYCIDEKAAAIVRLIFSLALEGKANIEIARMLNGKKIPTPGMYKKHYGGGKHGLKENQISIWDSTKVLNILRDERYKGTVILGRYQSAGVGSGKTIETDKDMWYRMENAIPAIISECDFDKVQKLRPYQKRGKYQNDRHILYRKVRCGCCGRFLYYKPSDSGRQYDSYFCKQSHLDPESRCFTGYIKMNDILDAILKLLQKHIDTYQDAEKMKGKKKQIGNDKQRMIWLDKRLDLLKAKKLNDYQDYREQRITRDEYLRQKELNQGERQRLEDELSLLQDKLAEASKENEAIKTLRQWSRLNNLDREIVEQMVEMIWVYDVDRVKIELKYNLN